MTEHFIDEYGRIAHGWHLRHRTAGMSQPVQCRCGGVYDLGTVEVTARYADCSMWNAPCCKALVDDRGERGWKSLADYTRLPRHDGDLR